MKINHWGRARQFIKAHPEAESPLRGWKRVVIEANWTSFPDLKTSWNSADWYKGAIVFDIGGNNFRLIAICRFELDRLYIDKVLTHEEYESRTWKKRYAKRKTTEVPIQSAVQPDQKYLDCIKRFPLKPIRSDAENELAAEICDRLLDRLDSLSPLEHDYLAVLSRLVEDYEAQWQEEKDVEPRELLTLLMERNNLTQTDLIPEFGTSSRASEFLSGKRALSLSQISKLAKRFNLSPSAFISL